MADWEAEIRRILSNYVKEWQNTFISMVSDVGLFYKLLLNGKDLRCGCLVQTKRH